MSEEPTLPPLPAIAWDSGTQSFANTRKRVRNREFAISAVSDSSDPAVFSSDDDPHVENYAGGRHRKKRYVGSWFQQHPTSSDSTFVEPPRPLQKVNRTFQRQFDSGVWMGSDNSIDMEDDPGLSTNMSAESSLPPHSHARPMANISPSEKRAREIIQNAIVNENPIVDFSTSNLESISNATISQLSIFDTMPLIDESFPFASKAASMELYLSNNPLSRAPGAIFNLENLVHLSLRNTQITELPPSIRNLRNLETLNLSLTRLRCLPGELLDLMRFPSKLQTLRIHPNPFYRPDHFTGQFDEQDVWDESLRDDVLLLEERTFAEGSILRVWLDKNDVPSASDSCSTSTEPGSHWWSGNALARSPIQYSDSRGVIVSKFQLPQPGSTHLVIQTEDLESSPSPPRYLRGRFAADSCQSSVPSLFELALQSCAKTGQLRELPSYLPSNAPPHFSEVLDRIAEQSEENANCGDLPCSICGRRVMMPMTQWIEWWQLAGTIRFRGGNAWAKIALGNGSHECAIPFLRRGCSWKCVPKAMKHGDKLPGTLRSSVERPEFEMEMNS